MCYGAVGWMCAACIWVALGCESNHIPGLLFWRGMAQVNSNTVFMWVPRSTLSESLKSIRPVCLPFCQTTITWFATNACRSDTRPPNKSGHHHSFPLLFRTNQYMTNQTMISWTWFCLGLPIDNIKLWWAVVRFQDTRIVSSIPGPNCCPGGIQP